jgi:hypothetical protein
VNIILAKANELERQGLKNESLDVIFDGLDNLCWECHHAGNWKKFDEFIASVKTTEHSTCVLLSLLTCSAWAKSKLSNRSEFFERCKKTIEDRGENERGLLDGLE